MSTVKEMPDAVPERSRSESCLRISVASRPTSSQTSVSRSKWRWGIPPGAYRRRRPQSASRRRRPCILRIRYLFRPAGSRRPGRRTRLSRASPKRSLTVQQVVEGTAESNRAAASNVPSPNGQSTTDTEAALAEVLTDLLTVDGLSVESNFFEDLGADSLKMAHFCVRVRKRDDLPSISIRDVYENPTIKRLAAAVEHGAPSNVEPSVPAPAPAPSSARTSQYVLCGTLQLLAFVAYCYLAALVGANLYDWIAAGSGLVDMYLRAVIFSGGVFFAVCTLPIVAKWLLIGRWKPQPVPIWSLAYFRFWLVKVLVRSNPGAHLFVGSPLYNLYLRALGAKIGPGVAIFSRHLPVCTDLLTIGANTVVRRDSLFPGYRAYAGRIETGRITIGRDALVGEKAVLDIDTSVGDGAQLGHASVLHPGQVIPAGERWHGSPAEPTDVDYLRVPQGRRSRLRQIGFSVNSVLAILFLALPLLEGG